MSPQLLSGVASVVSGAEGAYNANSTYGFMTGLSQTAAALVAIT